MTIKPIHLAIIGGVFLWYTKKKAEASEIQIPSSFILPPSEERLIPNVTSNTKIDPVLKAPSVPKKDTKIDPIFTHPDVILNITPPEGSIVLPKTTTEEPIPVLITKPISESIVPVFTPIKETVEQPMITNTDKISSDKTTVETITTTPPISGLIYVIDPKFLMKTLPLTALRNTQFSSYIYSPDLLYTTYDITKLAPILEGSKLISQYATPELKEAFEYYDDLLTIQKKYYEERQKQLEAKKAKKLSITGNDRIFKMLNIVIDNQTYREIGRNTQKYYMPIETWKMPTATSDIANDIIQMPSTPSSFIGPIYVPSDGNTHEYHILGDIKKYPSGAIFGFVRTSDNAVIEFYLNDLFYAYENRNLQQAFSKMAELFLHFISLKKYLDIVEYTQIPAWDTPHLSGRLVNNPSYEVIRNILAKEPTIAQLDITNLRLAVKYDVPVQTIIDLVTKYNTYKQDKNDKTISLELYFANNIMSPKPSVPATTQGYTEYYKKIDNALQAYLYRKAGNCHFSFNTSSCVSTNTTNSVWNNLFA